MVQTYEGALTETDSILQRMKTLADQAANGTYQDDVDRDAIQLEFNQLNDELDQIADTDFNGVVVLNGGQMSDGLKAVGGKFDYTNYVRNPTEVSGDSSIFNTVDDSNYNTTKAKALWTKLGLSSDVTSVDVTYTWDGSKWTGTSNSAGTDMSTYTATTSKSNGGFIDGVSGANVVLDETKLMAGDTVTLTYTNKGDVLAVPGNGGFDENLDVVTTKGTFTADKITTTWAAGDVAVTDLTEDMAAAIDNLNNATFSLSYASDDGTVHSATVGGTSWKTADLGNAKTVSVGNYAYQISVSDAGAIEVSYGGKTLGTWTVTNGNANDGTAQGTVSGGLSIDAVVYDKASLPDISVNANKVSISNAYNQASAPLTYTDHVMLQAGARTKDLVDFTFKYSTGGMGDLKANMNCSSREDGLGTANLSLKDQKSANYAIDRIDNAINKVSMVRATFGAVQNRLEHKIDNMNVTKENMTSAESRIRDTNMAEEMTNFTKNQILSQASQAMLAQANQLPQGVLQLLG